MMGSGAGYQMEMGFTGHVHGPVSGRTSLDRLECSRGSLVSLPVL